VCNVVKKVYRASTSESSEDRGFYDVKDAEVSQSANDVGACLPSKEPHRGREKTRKEDGLEVAVKRSK
jgi:hypothetical protein